MIRWAAMLAVIAAIACGGSESTQDRAATAAPEKSAASAPSAQPDVAPRPSEVAETVDPKVTSCLDLVGQAKFAEALPVCLEAAQIDPNNEQVQAAIAKAKQEVASATAEGALGAAGGETAGQLDSLKGKLPDGLAE